MAKGKLFGAVKDFVQSTGTKVSSTVTNAVNNATANIKPITQAGKEILNSGIEAVHNAEQRAIDLGRKGIDMGKQLAGYSVLLPYTLVMRSALDKRGIKYDNRIDDITGKFYTNVVAPRKRYSFHADYHLAETPVVDMGASMGGAAIAAEVDVPPEVGNMAGKSIVTVVKAVLEFIKNLKAKKDSGAKLSPEEKMILENTEKVSAQFGAVVGEIKKSEKEQKIGAFFSDNWILILIAAVVVLFLLFK